jgi:hypothetical protein
MAYLGQTVFLGSNNKFWGKLIAYFPSTRQGTYNKRSAEQFFHFSRVLVAALMLFPSRCLSTYT